MKKTDISPKHRKGVSFNEKVKLLQEFRKVHKRFPGTNENKMLYLFMSELRNKKKFNELAPATCNKLDKIHFEWDRNEVKWDLHHDTVIRLMNGKNGKNEIRENIKLKEWLNRNITLYFRGEMEEAKKKKFKLLLKKLEIKVKNDLFIYEKIKIAQSFSPKWINKFNEAKEYLAKYNQLPPVTSKVYQWCAFQKNHYEKLSPERKQMLEKIDFLNYFDRWTKKYESLTFFFDKYSRLPDEKDNSQLYGWINLQRRLWSRGELTSEMIAGLKKLGIAEPVSQDQQWQLKFRELQLFRKKFPNRWPSDNIKGEHLLAKWILRERYKAKNYSIGSVNASDEKKVQLLNSIGFKWSRMVVREDQWMQSLKRMQQLTKRRKDGRFSWTKENDTPVIRSWFNTNVTNLNNGTLSEHRTALLKKAKII